MENTYKVAYVYFYAGVESKYHGGKRIVVLRILLIKHKVPR